MLTDDQIAINNLIAGTAWAIYGAFSLCTIFPGLTLLFIKGRRRLGAKLLAGGIAFAIAGLCVFSVLVTSRDMEQIKQGYEEAQNATVVKTEQKLLTLKHGNHGFQIFPPQDFELEESLSPSGKTFMFSGTKGTKFDSCTFSVMVLDTDKDNQFEPEMMIDSMIAPFRENSFSSSQQKMEPQLINGHRFSGATFSGAIAFFWPVKGFVLATPVKDALFVINAECPKDMYDKVYSTFMDTLKTCKVIN